MASSNDEAAFTFSWLALKLLGRGLYSNPWSALSELVANGLDAGASQVWVYVDARDKANAVVEVLDNGSGMSRQDINTYVKVGHDKRKSAQESPSSDYAPKGRKGIGKLAALFLSPHFYLSTKHADGSTSWELDGRDGRIEDDATPRLLGVSQTLSTPNDALWSQLATGTRLTMAEVDLTGYGPQAISALGIRLANQFLLPVSSNPSILLWVRSGESTNPDYVVATKSIAFKNFSEVATNIPNSSFLPTDLNSGHQVTFFMKGLPGGKYIHDSTRSSMRVRHEQDDLWAAIENDLDPTGTKYKGIPFSLTGWIGIHTSIDNESAQFNDERFTRNRFYNPSQLRVYVRGKLASDHLLTQLDLNGTYVSYIEGEISFDLLDDDSLPDIATANRQDFDETDNRVTLLRALVRPVVRGLILRRNQLAKTLADKVKAEKERLETASKQQFSEQVGVDLANHEEISQETRDNLQLVITNKIKGNVTPKQNYRVFISHSSSDELLTSFIDDVLQSLGVDPEEIFYTSRRGDTKMFLDEKALGEVVKRNIISDNTLVFYMTSKNFLGSEFCLFEGGAGWATRSVDQYLKLNVDYQSIPKWLTNGRGEATLINKEQNIELTPELHNYLVDGVLNKMIAHLNRGRQIMQRDLITPLERADLPSALEMKQAGRTESDYFDARVVEHWTAAVGDNLAEYLVDYFAQPNKTSPKQ